MLKTATIRRILLVFIACFAGMAAMPVTVACAEGPAISGRLEGGYRILTVPPAGTPMAFTVYRGDYVKFEIPPTDGEALLVVPALGIEQRVSGRIEADRHVTMRRTGVLPFKLNERPGTITIVDFKRPNYRELTAVQAADTIARFEPLILDVRTPREYQAGHLPGARLLPVQLLQANIEQLAAYRDREILIYCATGNRSTVAAKILMDNGFKQIANLRHGIADWRRRQLPVVP